MASPLGVLKDMGLTSPFGGRLTEMVDSPTIGEKLYVSNILYKACIEVDEEVTEAAAVSIDVVRPVCLSLYIKEGLDPSQTIHVS